MVQNSPYRWGLFTKMSSTDPNRNSVLLLFYSRYKYISGLQAQDPQLYQMGLRRLQLEDQRWDLEQRMHQIPPPEPLDKLNAKLKDNVNQAVALWIQEREYRLNLFRAELQRQQTALEADKARQPAIAEEWLTHELNRSGDFPADMGNRDHIPGGPDRSPDKDRGDRKMP
jgi:hypothetical protein